MSVDDLVVSLTIKPTSNLGRLQKQLESLVGKSGRGVGAGLMYLKRDMKSMSREMKEIRRIVQYLRPSVLPGAGSKAAQRRVAGTLTSDIKKYSKEIVNQLMKSPNLGEYFKIFSAKTTDEVQEGIGKVLKDAARTGQLIAAGKSPLREQKILEYNRVMSGIVSSIRENRPIGKGMLDEIFRFTPEKIYRNQVRDVLNAKGAVAVEEMGLNKLKDELVDYFKNDPRGLYQALALPEQAILTAVKTKGAGLSKSVAAFVQSVARDSPFNLQQTQKAMEKMGYPSNLKVDDIFQYLKKLEQSGKLEYKGPIEYPRNVLVRKDIFEKLNPRRMMIEGAWKKLGGKGSMFKEGQKRMDVHIEKGLDKLMDIVDDPKIRAWIRAIEGINRPFGIEIKQKLTGPEAEKVIKRGYEQGYGLRKMFIVKSITEAGLKIAKEAGWKVAIVPTLVDELEKYDLIDRAMDTTELSDQLSELGEKQDIEAIEKRIQSVENLIEYLDGDRKKEMKKTLELLQELLRQKKSESVENTPEDF